MEQENKQAPCGPALSLLIDNLRDFPVAILNRKRQIVQANEAYHILFGHKTAMYWQQTDTQIPCPITEAFHTGLHQQVAMNIKGDTLYQINVYPIEPEKSTEHVLWIGKNISEQIRHKHLIQESQALLDALFENSPNLMFILDGSRKIKRANHAALRYHSSQAREKHTKAYFGNVYACINSFYASHTCGISPNCKRCRIKELVNYTLSTGKPRHNELATLTLTGKAEQQQLHYLVSTTRMQYEEETSILLILTDISEQQEMEKTILNHIIKAEEQEKEQLAAALHDEIGPILSGIKLYANDLEDEAYKLEERKEKFKNLESLIDLAVQQTKSISNSLMPHILVNFGLIEALEDFCQKIGMVSQVAISFQASPVKTDLSHTTRVILYRAVIELVNNTLKHAQASHIIILLKEGENHIRLQYQDDGKGFSLQEKIARKQGLGLMNLINRLKSINAQYYFNCAPGQGVQYEITLEKTKQE